MPSLMIWSICVYHYYFIILHAYCQPQPDRIIVGKSGRCKKSGQKKRNGKIRSSIKSYYALFFIKALLSGKEKTDKSE